MCLPKLQKCSNQNDSHPNSSQYQWNQATAIRRFRSKKECGFSTLGGTLLLLAILGGVGAITILHQLQNKISKQIEIDQLTGKTAIKLRASIISFQHSQKRLKIAHSSMLAGCVYLPACPTLTQAYEIQKKIELGIQNIAKQNWNLQKINWQVYLPITSQKNILPSLEFFSEMKELEIKIQIENLISVSKVWKNRGSISNDWKIAWIK